jgi:hypothetical protein
MATTRIIMVRGDITPIIMDRISELLVEIWS